MARLLPASEKRHAPDDSVAWSPYDDMVPHVTQLPAAREAFAALRRRRGADPTVLARVKEVIVVAASSRGGSTLVGELLRRCSSLLHLQAEINPLFAAAGLEPRRRTQALAEELAVDIGRPLPPGAPIDLDDFAATVAWRLVAAWPDAGIDPDDACEWVHRTVAEQRGAFPQSPHHDGRIAFWFQLFHRVRAAHPEVNPYYYDLPPEQVAAAFPGATPPGGPPGASVVEMPPFVVTRPWQRPSPDELAERPLVLSTPRNAFRLRFLREMFPAARFRLVHLTRNPAASINGLMDGWCHHGFFNVDVGDRLRIPGYSDRYPGWGRRWWNFDFWPGWEEWVDRPLAAVCAEQWRSHHGAVCDYVTASGVDVLRLRFEDVVGTDEERARACTVLATWLGDAGQGQTLAGLRLPPLMATAPPARGRWRHRTGEITAAVADPAVTEMAEHLGYADPDTWR